MNQQSPEHLSFANRASQYVREFAGMCFQGAQSVAYTHILPPLDIVPNTGASPKGLTIGDLRALQKLSRSPYFEVSIEVWLKEDGQNPQK